MNKTSWKGLSLLSLGAALALGGCKLFIFGGEMVVAEAETFDNCYNSVFFALYNYYGYEGQHFTNKWLGMNDSLAAHGIEVSNYAGQKDARRFKQTRTADCDLPEDATIYFVNNQNWDASIQFSQPIANYHPMAILSTCNGVEFASPIILASGMGIANATMGGFSEAYRAAFVDGSARYVCAKYTAHILPIFAAGVQAATGGTLLRNADGSALKLSITNWAIQNLSEYDELARVDFIDTVEHTLGEVDASSLSSTDEGIRIEVTSDPQEGLLNVGYEGTSIDLRASFSGETLEGEVRFESSNPGIVKVTQGEELEATAHLLAPGAATVFAKIGEEVKGSIDLGVGALSHHPTMRKINVDSFLSSGDVEGLSAFVSDSSESKIKEMYASNANNEAEDRASFRKGERLKVGVIVPSSLNDQVSKYVKDIQGYLAEAYNCEILTLGRVDNQNTQDMVATTLINQGAKFIVSLQDDTDRNKAAQICNQKGVYFAIGGSCQNDVDYQVIKDLPYYVGSIGTSPEEERRAAYYMTEYYLESMIQREKGSLKDWQNEYFTAKKEGRNILKPWVKSPHSETR